MAYSITKNEGTEPEIAPKKTVAVADEFIRRMGGELVPLLPTIVVTQAEYDAIEEKQDIVYVII